MTQVTVTSNSVNITTLDTQPLQQLTAGEGKPGGLQFADDYIHVTTAMLALGQSWRLCRFPTTAKIKRVMVGADAIMDTNVASTLALDLNIIFSDSTVDGTPASLQAGIPTSANTGAVTTVSAYSSPNKLFGTLTVSNNAFSPPKVQSFIQLVDVTFGAGSILYNSLVLTETPLWNLFGFTNAQGYPGDPGGYFDLNVNVSTAAATAQAANFYARVEYCV